MVEEHATNENGKKQANSEITTFREYISPPSSGSKSKPNKKPAEEGELISRRFGGTYRLHLKSRKMRQA
jgi:hypothetical protein